MVSLEKKICVREDGNPYFEMEVWEGLTYFICYWFGYTDFEKVKSGSEVILEIASRWNRKGILVDSSGEEGPWNDANNWINTNWLPRIFQTGIEKIAIVLSQNIFSVVSAREHAESAQSLGFPVKVFSDKNQAIQWLLQ